MIYYKDIPLLVHEDASEHLATWRIYCNWSASVICKPLLMKSKKFCWLYENIKITVNGSIWIVEW